MSVWIYSSGKGREKTEAEVQLQETHWSLCWPYWGILKRDEPSLLSSWRKMAMLSAILDLFSCWLQAAKEESVTLIRHLSAEVITRRTKSCRGVYRQCSQQLDTNKSFVPEGSILVVHGNTYTSLGKTIGFLLLASVLLLCLKQKIRNPKVSMAHESYNVFLKPGHAYF